jgi:hypothetical protein
VNIINEAATPIEAPDTSPPTTGDPRRWSALAVVCLAVFVTTLDGTIVNIALPTRARSTVRVS